MPTQLRKAGRVELEAIPTVENGVATKIVIIEEASSWRGERVYEAAKEVDAVWEHGKQVDKEDWKGARGGGT